MYLDWKHIETVDKTIRVIRVNFKERYVDVTDLETKMPISLKANKEIDLGKIKKAKMYRAVVKVFTADFTPELERQLVESAIGDYYQFKAFENYKASGSKPTRFELLSIRP
ncbi:MAG: hypothetical protein JXA54_01805 [Candidatus Heimdallarchaeota archaeon]|nr:hypothetical protein [Candidatus Heimdallarchaeota archaeon]